MGHNRLVACMSHWGAFHWSSFFQFLQQLWCPHWVHSGLLTQLLAAEDVAYFLTISQCLGHKPIPFIPVLDSTFRVWFEKVCAYSIPFSYTYVQSIYPFLGLLMCRWGHGSCLWPDSSMCVCTSQGPIAVKCTIEKDEPIGKLFGGIVSSLTDKLLVHQYGGDVTVWLHVGNFIYLLNFY